MSSFDKLTGSQKIRSAVHRDVRAISSETCHFLGLEVTKPAMDIIAELVYKKLTVYGADLEAFAKHAKRTVINSEDVKLLARRNPSLLAHLNTIVPSTNQTTNKRRKTTVKPQETPAKATETSSKNKEDSNKNKETSCINKENSSINKENPRKSTEQKDEGTGKTSDVNIAIDDSFEDMIVDDTIDLTFD